MRANVHAQGDLQGGHSLWGVARSKSTAAQMLFVVVQIKPLGLAVSVVDQVAGSIVSGEVAPDPADVPAQ